MADRNGYIGRAPGDSSVVVSRQIFNPTGVTTDFTFSSGYTVGYLDLYLNGTRLIEGPDYSASNGSTITLISPATNGDVLEGVAYKAFNLGDAHRVGVQSGGVFIGNAETLNFVGTGNTFAVNGSTIDVSISSGAASILVVPTRSGTAVTFTIPSTNVLGVVGRSGTVNVPV
nr:phage tail fiber-like protein [uncultured Mediterranean phage uvMED]